MSGWQDEKEKSGEKKTHNQHESRNYNNIFFPRHRYFLQLYLVLNKANRAQTASERDYNHPATHTHTHTHYTQQNRTRVHCAEIPEPNEKNKLDILYDKKAKQNPFSVSKRVYTFFLQFVRWKSWDFHPLSLILSHTLSPSTPHTPSIRECFHAHTLLRILQHKFNFPFSFYFYFLLLTFDTWRNREQRMLLLHICIWQLRLPFENLITVCKQPLLSQQLMSICSLFCLAPSKCITMLLPNSFNIYPTCVPASYPCRV